MALNLPRREKAAAKTGPRLEISPLELKVQLENEHGLSSLLTSAESWEPFAWKGNDLSSPLRALWIAEARGLLKRRNDRAQNIAAADITADINACLMEQNKRPISEATVMSNLRTASLYLQAALGVALIPDRKTMTVRFVDRYETEENIKRYFDQMEAKLNKFSSQLKHAEACGYDVSRVLQHAEESTGMKMLVSSNSNSNSNA